ncbi:MAG: hypothetical protein M3483_06730 [Gemmatimonadota bacterium]|nr:hypothetical protein [Gemmatimonadota bacterium]
MPIFARLSTFLLAALAAFSLSACDDLTLSDGSQGIIRANWGGRAWSGDADAERRGGTGDTLIIWATTPIGAGSVASGSLRLSVAYRGIGHYTLGAEDALVWHLEGGDVLTASYATAEPNAGVLRVEDDSGGWLSGEVDFVARHTQGGTPVGTSARFKGRFRVRVVSVP